MRSIRPALLALSLVSLAGAAQAEVIISNFNAATGTGTAFGGGASTQYKAFGFTMGADAFSLDDVTLTMTFNIAGATPQVSIYDDAGGTPGAILAILDNPAVLMGQADYAFTPAAPLTLAAGTTYWVYVEAVPMTSVAFLWEGMSPSTDPTGNATAVNYEFNGNPSTFRNRLEVNGTRGGGIGSSYCSPAVPNSTGVAGELVATGSNVVTDADVTLEATSLPQNSFGFFLVSDVQGLTMNPGGSQGNLCLGGGIGRYVGPGQIQNSGAAGAFSLAIDLTAIPTPTGFVAVSAGQTLNFQGWYRDSVMGAATSNFTDGYEVAFQ